MGTEAGSVKSKEQKRKEKKEAKPKVFEVVKYEPGAKARDEKATKLRDKDNRTYSAVILQALLAAKEPLTLPELLAAIAGKVEKRDGKVNVEANVRWYLNSMKHKGLVKSVDTKVEAKSQDEARGVE